jgi:hypothetical protein
VTGACALQALRCACSPMTCLPLLRQSCGGLLADRSAPEISVEPVVDPGYETVAWCCPCCCEARARVLPGAYSCWQRYLQGASLQYVSMGPAGLQPTPGSACICSCACGQASGRSALVLLLAWHGHMDTHSRHMF